MLEFRAVEPTECETLLWRTDGEYAPVTFLVDCGGLFDYACADSEPLTPENIAILEQAYRDIRAVEPLSIYGQELFCCRVRKMRPQGAFYKHLPGNHWPLFDACGQERAVDGLNTERPAQPLFDMPPLAE